MCAPLIPMAIAAATTAVAAASTIAGFQGQSQKYTDNAVAANTNFVNTNNALLTQATQADAAHSEDSLSAIIEGAKNAGRISASASSMGLGGSTTAGQENASAFETGRQVSVDDLNLQNRFQQIGTDRQSSFLERQTQINQVTKPTTASLVVGLADAAVKGASTYKNVGGKF